MSTNDLHVTELGDHGPRVAFFHGLFGQGKNWTQIGKVLAADHRVMLVDMPNHGRSAWTDRIDYLDLADRVASLFDPIDPAVVVGHSMGGKIAMAMTLRHRELVERLAVVDISPVATRQESEFAGYVKAMQGLDLDGLERRADADEQLASAVANKTVRSFLLQNLRHERSGWRWQPNLEVLGRDLEALGDWPAELADAAPYDGKVLWVAGADSGYVKEEYAGAMERLFPRVQRVTIKKAGHWVHSEQPEIFRSVLQRFLAAT
ncbi:MAG: alpha/beta fold hydrolase [Nocardioides sp.]|nr:alpha/beta fold hydrolase [Nocardioides sp.]